MELLRGVFRGHEKKRVMEKMFRTTVQVKGKVIKITNFDHLIKIEGPDVVVVVGQLLGIHGEYTYETASNVEDTCVNREVARGVATHIYQEEAKQRAIAFELARSSNARAVPDVVSVKKEVAGRVSLINQRI